MYSAAGRASSWVYGVGPARTAVTRAGIVRQLPRTLGRRVRALPGSPHRGPQGPGAADGHKANDGRAGPAAPARPPPREDFADYIITSTVYELVFMLMEKLLMVNFSDLLFVDTISTPLQIW